jgi:hypothetical protein
MKNETFRRTGRERYVKQETKKNEKREGEVKKEECEEIKK